MIKENNLIVHSTYYSKNKGITLMALVITIIILLILAGITINTIIGQDGLLRKAQIASEEYKKAQAKEELDMILMDIKAKLIREKGNIYIDDVVKELEKNSDIEIKNINPENLEIIVKYKNYDFLIDEDLNSKLISSGIDEDLNISEEIKIILEKANITEEDIKENGYEYATINATIEPKEKITKVTINGKEIEFDSETGNISVDVTENRKYKIIAYGEEQKYNYAIVTVKDLTEDLDIWTKEELVQFEKSVNNGRTYRGKTVRLKKDIDLKDIDWKPIGYSITDENYISFNGIFDGENCTISNITIDSRNHEEIYKDIGFMGTVLTGSVKNIIFDNPYIYSEKDHTAVVVGNMGDGQQKALIENVKVLNGEIVSNGNNSVGGINGAFDGTIENCYSNCTILGNANTIGGISGACYGKIKGCYNSGNITGSYHIGGIVGDNSNSINLRDC